MRNFLVFITDEIYFLLRYAGEWFYAVPAFLGITLLALLVIGIFSRKVRYMQKDAASIFTAAILTLWTACRLILCEKADSLYTVWSVALFGTDFLLAEILRLQSNAKVRLSAKEKRLIGRLSARHLGGDNAGGTIKRVEFLNEKNSPDDKIEPNFNEIKRIIVKLRKEELSQTEEDELDKTEMDMEKFSSRVPTPFERKILSERLMKIVKMMAKYHIA